MKYVDGLQDFYLSLIYMGGNEQWSHHLQYACEKIMLYSRNTQERATGKGILLFYFVGVSIYKKHFYEDN